MPVVLFLSVFLIAACGLIYELIAGTLASYLLGDSVLQFSTVIGSYLFAMGIGSWLSKYLARGLVARFIYIELMVGLVGGFSSSLLFLAFAWTESFRLVLYLIVLLIGTLVGLEIPLLMRILKERFQFHDLVAHVLDLRLPGRARRVAAVSAVAGPASRAGPLGAAVRNHQRRRRAVVDLPVSRFDRTHSRSPQSSSAVVLLALGAGMFGADAIAASADDNLYADEVIFARNTRYQRIVLTKWKNDLRLFLSSHLQFSSRDEYRYHEALVHPGLAALPGARHVLVLGGGDGLAVREILKYPSVEQITLVDLDPEMTKLFSTNPVLVELNKGSLKSPKVRVINDDAFPVARPQPGHVRFRRRRFSRSDELFARQALHDGVLPLAVEARQRERLHRGAEHIAAVRAAILLVHRQHTEAGGTENVAVSRVRALLRRVGIRAGRRRNITNLHDSLPDGLRFLAVQNIPELFRFATDMLPVDAEAEPAERSGTRALLRARVEGHRPLMHRRRFLSAALVGLNAKADRSIAGGFVNDGFPLGHKLRDRTLSLNSQARRLKFRWSSSEAESPDSARHGGSTRGAFAISCCWRWSARPAATRDRDRTKSPHFPGPLTTSRFHPRIRRLCASCMEEFGVLRDGEWNERYLCYSPQERLYLAWALAGRYRTA